MNPSIAAQKGETIQQNLVYMENIRVQFGKVRPLDGVHFHVGPNEVVGLLGDNGAGKTTLIKALIGYYPIASGAIFFEGRRTNFKSPRDAGLAGIETVYQDLALIETLSILRNFFLGRECYKKIGPLKLLDYPKMQRVLAEALREMGFTHIEKPIRSLSGGERQAIAIGRAFYFGAKLLILDEPTAALSESEAELVMRLVIKAKQKGLAVIFVTHKAHEVFEIADRFVVLQNGKNYADLHKEDVTIKQLEKLLISSRLLAVKEMAAGVAHQIRNPLGVMKLSAEMLRDDFKVVEQQEQYACITQMLLREIETLNLVVNNFLDFARPPKLNKTLCAIPEIINAALAQLSLENFCTVQIRIRIQDGLPPYPLDATLMPQALANLILNALQASPPHSPIEIRAFMENKLLVLEVQDWGGGFDAETRRQIFHPFFTTKAAGTGLGLAIVHRIVEQHHGTIDVSSVPAQGAIFRIVL